MFKLFGKKKAEEAQPPKESKNPALAALAAQFAPEELDVLAVTAPSAFGAARTQGGDLWMVSIALTAWMEEDSPELHQENTALVMLADDQLRDFLRQQTPSNFIIRTRARLALDGSRLLMLSLPEPGFDPDLKAILEEQKTPVERDVEGLGVFTLNRALNWFQADVDWLGQSVQLTYDNGTEADMAAAQDHARTLMAAQADLDGRIRSFAADRLLDQANAWSGDDPSAEDAAEPERITAQAFMERMEPEAISISPDGGYEFWFGDGDLFWGHSIHVSGSLADGPTAAEMEG